MNDEQDEAPAFRGPVECMECGAHAGSCFISNGRITRILCMDCLNAEYGNTPIESQEQFELPLE